MTTEDIEASQSGGDEVGVGGPGAPTPLSALEVGNIARVMLSSKANTYQNDAIGCCWPHKA
jgi:hypothetical protein